MSQTSRVDFRQGAERGRGLNSKGLVQKGKCRSQQHIDSRCLKPRESLDPRAQPLSLPSSGCRCYCSGSCPGHCEMSAVPLATQQVTAVNPPIPCDNLNISLHTSPKLLPLHSRLATKGVRRKDCRTLRQGHAVVLLSSLALKCGNSILEAMTSPVMLGPMRGRKDKIVVRAQRGTGFPEELAFQA